MTTGPTTNISETHTAGRLLAEGSRAMVSLAVVVLVAFNAVGLLLVVRRFVGALSEQLPREAMLLTAIVAGAMMVCLRIAWRKKFPLEEYGEERELTRSQQIWDWVIGYGSSLALVLLAVGCCYPGDHTSDWLIWLPLLVADQFWRQSFFDAGHPERGLSETALDDEVFENEALLATTFVEQVDSPAEGVVEAEETEEIVQQLFRVRDELGQEVIYGTLKADFLAGQRTAVVHAGFCPPLPHLPEIEAESFRGPEARIKIVQAFAHGTRMDVRLTAPAEQDCQVWIDMAATPRLGSDKIGG